ncbi:M4 family metallopeptidase [Sulfidibacter corallicola]|uniref:M4 family metallopeptidase n=1 Tax=Sulfidibacter corallicola TaxID=2818388 RepID=A0A8A4TG61_SULCO|nr:M4 family metallopeptidase [Sulfidibacter corallicola]QTD47761.1 M4 family metallopeptidase [Sulfidibacter corallicola]
MKPTFLFSLLVLIYCSHGFGSGDCWVESVDSLAKESGTEVRWRVSQATGVIELLAVRAGSEGSLLPRGTSTPTHLKKVDIAKTFMARFGSLFGMKHADRDLVLIDEFTDKMGVTHLSFGQRYRKVPVFATRLRFHIDGYGRLRVVNGAVVPGLDLSTQPTRSAEMAAAEAMAHYLERYARVPADRALLEEPVLTIYRKGLDRGVHGKSVLTWRVELGSVEGRSETMFIDAHTAKLVDVLPRFRSLAREVFDGGTTPEFLVWQEGDPLPFQGNNAASVNELIQGSLETFHLFASLTDGDYLSFDGQDGLMSSLLNPPDGDCPNAFWSGAMTVFCEGFAVDDVIAHEWTHAYTDYTNNLIYRWQPGALNESYSDIFGELVDLLNLRDQVGTQQVRVDGGISTFRPAGPEVVVNANDGSTNVLLASGATFGVPVTQQGLSSMVVPVASGGDAPLEGCSELVNAAEVAGRIGLVDRGSCFFVDKARFAEQAGAIGLIVINQEGDELLTMAGAEDAPVIGIPAVMIGRTNGQALRAALARNEVVSVTVRGAQGQIESSARWVLGEDLATGGLRDMWRPNSGRDPDRVSDPHYHCGPEDSDFGGVHVNSGINNRAFSLLVDGGTANGIVVEPIGMTKAAHIFWRAMSVYLTAVSDFTDNADALMLAAGDLQGIPLQSLVVHENWPGPSEEIIDTQDVLQVERAIQAVEMQLAPVRCTFATNLDPAEVELCAASTVDTLFFDDFEGDVGSWRTFNLGIFDSFTERDWAVTENLPEGRTGRAFYAEDVGLTRNCGVGLNDESGMVSLLSPVIAVPETGDVWLSFEHYFSTEKEFDGGNVKIRADNGDFVLIPSDAFAFNGYSGALSTNRNQNPLSGQQAFHGINEGVVTGGTWGTSLANLSALLQGATRFQLRFDFGMDTCVGDDGWYLNSVRVFQCVQEVVHHEASNRWITHVTRQGAGFTTNIQLVNEGELPVSIKLQPYLADGTAIAAVNFEVPGAGRLEMSSIDAFGSRDLSHFSIVGPETCRVSVSYQMVSDQNAVAQVGEFSHAGKGFEVTPGDSVLFFDGVALVNLAEEANNVSLQLLDAAGDILTTHTIQDALAPKAKHLVLLGQFLTADTARVKIVTPQPAAVLFLRGTNAGIEPGSLVEVVPTVTKE